MMRMVMIRMTKIRILKMMKPKMMMLTLTFAESAEDFCFFFSLAANEVDDTLGFEAADVLTDVLNLLKQRCMN